MQGKCYNIQLTEKGVLHRILSDIDKHLVMQKYFQKPHLLKKSYKNVGTFSKNLQNG